MFAVSSSVFLLWIIEGSNPTAHRPGCGSSLSTSVLGNLHTDLLKTLIINIFCNDWCCAFFSLVPSLPLPPSFPPSPSLLSQPPVPGSGGPPDPQPLPRHGAAIPGSAGDPVEGPEGVAAPPPQYCPFLPSTTTYVRIQPLPPRERCHLLGS